MNPGATTSPSISACSLAVAEERSPTAQMTPSARPTSPANGAHPVPSMISPPPRIKSKSISRASNAVPSRCAGDRGVPDSGNPASSLLPGAACRGRKTGLLGPTGSAMALTHPSPANSCLRQGSTIVGGSNGSERFVIRHATCGWNSGVNPVLWRATCPPPRASRARNKRTPAARTTTCREGRPGTPAATRPGD